MMVLRTTAGGGVARQADRRPLLPVGLAVALVAGLLGGCLQFHQGPAEYPGKPFSYVEVDGVNVHYREMKPQGAEPGENLESIVLLHGYGGALISWFYCQPVLSKRFRTVSLDLKGFGLTDKPPGDYSIEAQAALVVKVMDQLGIERSHLVAHSWGSSVALTVAARYPQRVDKLVIVSGFVYEEQLNTFMCWARLPVLGELLYGAFYNEQLEARYTWGYYEPERFIKADHFDYLAEFQEVPGLKAAALEVVRGMDLASLEPSYPRIVHPALLIWGENDRVSPVPYGQRLATDLPNARMRVLGRAGHNAMLERAGTFTTLVWEFLGS